MMSPTAPAEGCGARETWGPGSVSSPYGLLASTPHIAAAPLTNYVVGLRPSRGASDTQREAEKLTRQRHDDRKGIEKKMKPGRLLAYWYVG